MAIRCKEPVRTKIIIHYQTVDQMIQFNYTKNDTDYDVNYDVDIKLDTFKTICGAINRILLKKKTRREAKLRFYEVMGDPCFFLIVVDFGR